MHPLLEDRKRQREEFIAVAREYAKILRGEIGPLCAVLIGSVARGDFNLSSDIDVLVVSDLLPASPLERSRLLYRHLLPGIEPHGFLPAEFRREKARRNPFVLEALSCGILLADDGFWAEMAAET